MIYLTLIFIGPGVARDVLQTELPYDLHTELFKHSKVFTARDRKLTFLHNSISKISLKLQNVLKKSWIKWKFGKLGDFTRCRSQHGEALLLFSLV